MRLETDDWRRTLNVKKRILLVDDDRLIGDIILRFLETFGYWVNFKSNPSEALDHFRQNPHNFDLVITDMMMPEMKGCELAYKITTLRKNIPVIVCTGTSMSLSEQQAAQTGIRAVITKPVTMRELRDTVCMAIEEAEA